jgi:hypothetical protein
MTAIEPGQGVRALATWVSWAWLTSLQSPAQGQRLVLNAGLLRQPVPSTSQWFPVEYPMVGSGTWDLLPGLTYLGESESWAWGAQAMGTVRLGENDNDYRLGNRYRLSAWGQYKVADWFGPLARLDWHGWYDIHGADPQLDPARNPLSMSKQAERLTFCSG